MIELHNVTKSYSTLHGKRYVFRGLTFSFPDNVSIGLIGPNGAGKSTLLRLLGGIDRPDYGSIVTDAHISWPVGLSGGMQGSLTGRDNVKFVCRIFGASGDAMRRKIAYVQEFAAIGEYFDLPVKSYSSGMRSRLTFGLSMAFDFDYYLIDEVMSVGDAEFRRKSHNIFQTKLETAKLILVSHNMNDIRTWCDVVVLVKDGTATLFEDVKAGVAAYQGPLPPRARKRRRPPAVAPTPVLPVIGNPATAPLSDADRPSIEANLPPSAKPGIAGAPTASAALDTNIVTGEGVRNPLST